MRAHGVLRPNIHDFREPHFNGIIRNESFVRGMFLVFLLGPACKDQRERPGVFFFFKLEFLQQQDPAQLNEKIYLQVSRTILSN